MPSAYEIADAMKYAAAYKGFILFHILPLRQNISYCVLELFFEIFVEGIFELIGHCYIKLMQLIVPDKIVSEETKKTIRNIATTFAALLAIVLIIGFIFLIQDDPFVKNIGKYMTYIPLGIMALQVLIGILVKLVGHFKK